MEIFQNIYYLQTKKKSTDVRHLVYTRNGLSLGIPGVLRDIYGLVYTASKPIRLQEIYVQYYKH